MQVITTLESYADERGNRIEYDGEPFPVKVTFHGSDNVLTVATKVRTPDLIVQFDGDGGRVRIGPSRGVTLRAGIRVGGGSQVKIGPRVSSTSKANISAVEGATVVIGQDVMMASDVQIRSDDGHAIYDVRSGRRVNTARDIRVGAHVWLGLQSVLLGGARIGDGSVVGLRAVVTGRVPNNVVVVGAPARVVRRDVAWERPHLSMDPRDKSAWPEELRTPYWALTEETPARPSLARRVARRLRRG
ncbi:acyltransferase [Aeromicrobium sp. IC_218]|uniref:acyltransferase n=1 Tax=Aeromicrobium sp. IC_218 TaxID=2545468 RepID=UPI00103B7106|nr:acyltransferase [Aeromicrobium sp. IC_218]TCJ00073.1 acyltransferase [Aeromicrobium sp. IC_218]